MCLPHCIWIKGHVYVKVIGPTCRAQESQYVNIPMEHAAIFIGCNNDVL